MGHQVLELLAGVRHAIPTHVSLFDEPGIRSNILQISPFKEPDKTFGYQHKRNTSKKNKFMYISGKYKTATNTFFLEERQNLVSSNFPECKLQLVPAKQ